MTTTAVRTAEDKFADELIRQHLAGHITVRGIIGEAFRQGVMHGEAKSGAPEMLEALVEIVEGAYFSEDGAVVCRNCRARTAIGHGHIHERLCSIATAEAAIQKARGGQ